MYAYHLPETGLYPAPIIKVDGPTLKPYEKSRILNSLNVLTDFLPKDVLVTAHFKKGRSERYSVSIIVRSFHFNTQERVEGRTLDNVFLDAIQRIEMKAKKWKRKRFNVIDKKFVLPEAL